MGGVGVCGSVSQPSGNHDIAVRLALGAAPGAETRSVVQHAAMPAALGLAAGLAVAAGMAGELADLLVETSPTERSPYVAVGLFLMAVTVTASWLPVRRTTQVEPARVFVRPNRGAPFPLVRHADGTFGKGMELPSGSYGGVDAGRVRTGGINARWPWLAAHAGGRRLWRCPASHRHRHPLQDWFDSRRIHGVC